jgi:hypothetical protein
MIPREASHGLIFDNHPGDFLRKAYARGYHQRRTFSRNQDIGPKEDSVDKEDEAASHDNAKDKFCCPAEPFFLRRRSNGKNEKEQKDAVFNKICFSVIDKGPEDLHPRMSL